MHKKISLYIHIPFCKSKCPYCDFYSMRGNKCDYNDYVEILKEKIILWSQKVDAEVETIYFGGGTPSVLGAESLCDILETIKFHFKLTDNPEITFEVNPASGKFFDFKMAQRCGFNRVSIGVQSINENELKALGRIHSVEDVVNTINLSKKAGIGNISVDLMMGIPHQDINSLKKSMDFCIEQNVTHISSYILKIEENTVFHKRLDTLNLPDDDSVSDLYLYAVDYLNNNGFKQYEISNFSKNGFESKHNCKYWELKDYIGIGPSAHSFYNEKRFYYSRSLEDFKNDVIIQDGIGGTKEEYLMLGMRMKKGVNLNKYQKAFGIELTKGFEKKIKLYCQNGLMNCIDGTIFFTPQGMLVSNSILSDLIFD